MGAHENIAKTTGNVFNGKSSPFPTNASKNNQSNDDQASLFDFFVPVFVLIGAIFSGILYSGDFYLFGGSRTFAEALRHAAAAKGLFLGGAYALIFALIYYLLRGRLTMWEVPRLVFKGSQLMLSATLVLMLAWTLGGLLRHDLGTGHYLATILTSSLPMQLVPVMFFVASLITSFAIGSSWGTAAVMFPIAIQLIVGLSSLDLPIPIEQLPLLYPALGAILSGCIAGNHISPISDTTIMSATSTAMAHADHVETQLTYTLPLIAVTAFSFLCLGCFINFGPFTAIALSLPLALAMMAIMFVSMQQRQSLSPRSAMRPTR